MLCSLAHYALLSISDALAVKRNIRRWPEGGGAEDVEVSLGASRMDRIRNEQSREPVWQNNERPGWDDWSYNRKYGSIIVPIEQRMLMHLRTTRVRPFRNKDLICPSVHILQQNYKLKHYIESNGICTKCTISSATHPLLPCSFISWIIITLN